MPDTETPTNPFAAALSGFFFAGDKNDPRVNPQLRQKLALAMMAHGTKYPKNLGEGIAAVGENFADAIMQRRLEQADIAQQGINPPPAAGAAPAQVSSLAPSDSVVSQPQVIPPPAPPPATVPQQAPGRGFTPVSMQPGAGEMIEPSEYNAVDAADPRNRYKPAPAYLQPALERNIQDPERRSYLGQLAGKEAQRPGEVSSTGAAGPFQFTRGTGAQYGIPGNARFDPDASTIAANALTDDNANTLTTKLGREPSPGELALAHQQGAGTAANMLTGAGNAPALNLAVNNVPASMGPQAAAQKVMGYYGMPGPVGGGRDAVAAALLAQQQPPSSGRPSVADYGQPRALAATPPDSLPPEISTGASAISAAPPQPSGIRAAPPQQVAQAQPQAIPGYVPPELKDPTGAPIIGMKPREAELTNWLNAETARGNPYAAAKVSAELTALQNERTTRQSEANEKYKADLARATKRDELIQQARMSQAEKQQAYQKGQQGLVTPEAASAVDPRVLGTSQSPQRTGIPTPPPRPPNITPEKWAELQAPKLAAVNDAVDKATPALQESLRLINEARIHSGRQWGLGATGSFMRDRAGTDAFAFGTLNKQITGKNFLAGYETLKGAGAIGEKEGAKAEQAQAQVDPNMAPKDYDAALTSLENTLKENLEIAQRKANRPVTAWQRTPNDEPAPDIGQIGLRQGKPSQYIGGNPKLDSSYRDVR